ncbi:hypothetical protein [Spirosoma areae]
MGQKSGHQTPTEFSNERAVAWARQMMARKRAEQKRMVEVGMRTTGVLTSLKLTATSLPPLEIFI